MPTPRTVQQLHDLTGRTALVTGGSRGLGFQMAQALGEAGARLLISARKARHLVDGDTGARIAAALPLRRLGDDEGLKGAVLLFASDAGKHITGQLLPVDGGASAVVG